VAEEETLGPLPAGRHGFSREQVAHNQRERLIAGLATAVAEHGYQGVTITHIIKEARVSRRVFYANFEGKEECFLAAFEVVVGHIRELAAEAVAPLPEWPGQAVAASRAVLAFLSTEPDLARHEAVHEVVPFLERGRAERPSGRELPPTTEESTIGALVMLASRKVTGGEAAQLEDLLPDFAEFILAPYLGAEEASRFAGRSP
jgi:AcrR family transcriptional regulator